MFCHQVDRLRWPEVAVVLKREDGGRLSHLSSEMGTSPIQKMVSSLSGSREPPGHRCSQPSSAALLPSKACWFRGRRRVQRRMKPWSASRATVHEQPSAAF